MNIIIRCCQNNYVKNISQQTKEANCNSGSEHGQLFFENKILKFLGSPSENEPDTKHERRVFYQIEEVFIGGKSLGRVLYYEMSDPSLSDDKNYVFLTNQKKG